MKRDYIHLPPYKRIWEVTFKDDAKQFLQTTYTWNSLTIQDIEWKLHSIQFNTLPTSGKRSIARLIHHHLWSVSILLKTKHRCPFCVNTDHDHYLTCAFTRLSKTKRITSITVKLDKLHTPRFLRDTIIHVINEYYNNGLVDDYPENYPIPFNHKEIIKCTHLQDRIG